MHRRTTTSTTTSTAATATLLALLALAAGCGEQDSGGATPTSTPTQTATETPTQTPTQTQTRAPTTPPSEGEEKIRVVGQVAEIGDCVVVRDDNEITWTITGEHVDELRLHDRVQVTGAPDLTATGCGGPLVQATDVTVLPPVE
jgi:hypothetical protein